MNELSDLVDRPLLETIFQRRTHRVSRGVATIKAGSMTYRSTQVAEPLTPLEEAILINVVMGTGLTMPDRPFQDPATGAFVMAKPNLTMHGRSAGSPDNAQGTHFFMIDDSGTYYLRNLPAPDGGVEFEPDALIQRAEQAKVTLLDHRIDVPGSRDFPAYFDSNRLLSNVAGTTIFFPVVDLSHQYINGLMYLLTQPDGARPAFVDDHNQYRLAGVEKWVASGFLNDKIRVPLGPLGGFRTQIEPDLLLQTVFLVAEAMGLGSWIHGCLNPSILLGDPRFTPVYGPMLGFDFVTPPYSDLDNLRWNVPSAQYAVERTHPVGLKHGDEYLIRAMCPPYFASMAAAVDEVVRLKFGAGGVYDDAATFGKIYKGDFEERYLREAPQYSDDVVACARDICEYIHQTHGRFPAHVDALFAPGVWIQVSHPDTDYYDRYFRNGLTGVQRAHFDHWHAPAVSRR
ncbi:MAG TPA: hypothetical protein VNW46_08665 [Gemmatimonadaceae bacterium]|jgi:hypothetical protein|nr:hypothetical protein [Gemmatimonadaceae bacterium]